MEAKNCAREKTREYCSENAEVSGRNFIISYEKDKAEREREKKWRSQKVQIRMWRKIVEGIK